MSKATLDRPGWLFVLPWDEHHPGGVNQVVVNLRREAVRLAEISPSVLVQSWEDVNLRALPSGEGMKYFLRLREPFDPQRPVRSTAVFVAALPRQLAALWRLLRAEQVEVVNLHYPTLAAFNFVLLKRLRLFRGRLVLSLHGLDVRGALRESGVRRWLWRALFGAADAIVACSTSLKAEALRLAPEVAGRIQVIHNGVDPVSVRDKASPSIGRMFGESEHLLVNVATFEHKKAHDVLLAAFASLAACFPGLRLRCIGRDGETRAATQALAERFGVADRLELYTNVPHAQALRLMSQGDVFVLPSRAEGFPIVLLEAAALGLPVVATDVDGVPELIRHGQDGLLVPAEDAKALAAAVARVLDDRLLRDRLAESLSRRVEQGFSWRQALQRYLVAGGLQAVNGPSGETLANPSPGAPARPVGGP